MLKCTSCIKIRYIIIIIYRSGAEEALTMNTTVTVSSEKLKYYFEDNKMNNLYVYVGATSLACVIVLSSVIFFFNITITASRNLHDRMLGSILKAPIHFFDTTSTGMRLSSFFLSSVL